MGARGNVRLRTLKLVSRVADALLIVFRVEIPDKHEGPR